MGLFFLLWKVTPQFIPQIKLSFVLTIVLVVSSPSSQMNALTPDQLRDKWLCCREVGNEELGFQLLPHCEIYTCLGPPIPELLQGSVSHRKVGLYGQLF